ncbi:hypothetical protein [Romboutsia sp.]|uniref:hypothetical protein n=1 Tax=Romboutsia sp. TaxID=1965302 RepID=UPI003F348A76
MVNNRNKYLEESNYYNLANKVYCLEFLNRFIKTKLSKNLLADKYEDIDFDSSSYKTLLDWNDDLV